MRLEVDRPHCRRPIFAATLNFALCLAVISAAILGSLPASIYWLAFVFGVCGILFAVLAVTKPGTTISIDDTKITRSGGVLGGSLYFHEIANATLERDPDAQNFKQMTLRSHGGRTLLVDARFLNPDIDGLVDLLRERLQQHGIELVTKGITAGKGVDRKPDRVPG